MYPKSPTPPIFKYLLPATFKVKFAALRFFFGFPLFAYAPRILMSFLSISLNFLFKRIIKPISFESSPPAPSSYKKDS